MHNVMPAEADIQDVFAQLRDRHLPAVPFLLVAGEARACCVQSGRSLRLQIPRGLDVEARVWQYLPGALLSYLALICSLAEDRSVVWGFSRVVSVALSYLFCLGIEEPAHRFGKRSAHQTR